jgi:SAM-dependent methyltransferase
MKFYLPKSYLFYILIILLLFVLFTCKFNINENFSNNKTLSFNNDNLYDDFYSNIYDELVFDETKNKYEIDEIKRITKMNPSTSNVLDIGSGTGHHINTLSKNNIQVIGIDNSQFMVDVALNKFPQNNITLGDATDEFLFRNNTFTHINCLYFTIYYIRNKKQFFKNCFNWLKHGGYLALHLVNRDSFNPIINSADPLNLVSPQKYSKKRITNSSVKFNDFQYTANFELNNNIGHFNETFKFDKNGNKRKNNHTLYMDTQKDILRIAKDTGFILHGNIDMVNCQYEYQYIYILYKP